MSRGFLVFLIAVPLLGCPGGQGGPEQATAAPAVYQARTATQWAAQLHAEERSLRGDGAWALVQLGPAAVPELRAALQTPGEPRRLAAWALGRIGEAAVGVLLSALESPEAELRWCAANALGDIGPRVPHTVTDKLLPALRDEAPQVRAEAAAALGRIGQQPARVVPRLIPLLGDEVDLVRSNAVHALGWLGPAATKAIPPLCGLLKYDPHPRVRGAAAEALEKIGTSEQAAFEALVGALRDRDDWVRTQAANALGVLGSNSDIVLPLESLCVEPLAEALQYLEVAWNAAEALRRLGPRAKPAVPALVVALANKDAGLRCRAIRALEEIGPAALEARDALEKALDDKDEDVRYLAALALCRVAPEQPQSAGARMELILEALEHAHDAPLRQKAAQVLGEFGPSARAAVPALEDAVNDKAETVREAARNALLKIQRHAS